MKFTTSHNSPIDRELSDLVRRYERVLIRCSADTEGQALSEAIMDFRYKLAYNRATEDYESRYGWTPMFETMLARLDEDARGYAK